MVVGRRGFLGESAALGVPVQKGILAVHDPAKTSRRAKGKEKKTIKRTAAPVERLGDGVIDGAGARVAGQKIAFWPLAAAA